MGELEKSCTFQEILKNFLATYLLRKMSLRKMDGIIDLARALADQEIKQLRLDHEKTKSDLENTNVELSVANENIKELEAKSSKCQIQMESLQKDLKVSTEKSENLQAQLKAKEDEL